MISAESAYLFRHALMRDAAYELLPPTGRGALHLLAAAVIESVLPVAELDAAAAELAAHYRRAREHSDDAALLGREQHFTRQAASAATRDYCNREAISHWLRLAEIDVPAAAAEHLRCAADVSLDAGQISEAQGLLERALGLDAPAEDRVKVHGTYAQLLAATGREAEAAEHYERALALAAGLNDRRSECILLGNLAALHSQAGRGQQAEEILRRTLALSRELGDRRNEGVWLGNLANLLYSRSEYAQAEPLYHQALAIAREAGDRRHECLWLGNLGMLQAKTGRVNEARSNLRNALAVVRDAGNRRFEGVILGYLAAAEANEHRYAESTLLYEHALRIDREVGNRRFEALHLCDYVADLLRLRRTQDAANAWQQAVRLMAEIGDPAAERRSAAVRTLCTELGLEPLQAK
jgi:tetratricopeptide (TPR) repeat protein